MTTFNAQAVADFLASKQFRAFEHQAPAMVSVHFGCTKLTATRWVNRVVESGLIRRNGRVALTLVTA
jgi:hypothetical protein